MIVGEKRQVMFEDGVTHINVYSKGETYLGQILSNFYPARFILPEDGTFWSVEGYWYWLLCQPVKDSPEDLKLRRGHGAEIKKYGQELRLQSGLLGVEFQVEISDFQNRIREALLQKILQNPPLRIRLSESTLPFKHYYVDAQGSPLFLSRYDWIVEFIEEVRAALK